MGWIFFMFCAAVCSAAKNIQKSDEVHNVERGLEEFVRRLTHQPLQTTQDMQADLLPQLNLPLWRHRADESSRDSDASISLGKFPFQSSLSRSGAHSFALASVSQKRPDEGGEINAKAAAYASIKDVNDEEHLEENEVSPEEFSDQSDKVSPRPTKRTEDATARKTAPYALKRQQTESVIKEEDSFSDIYFVAIVAGCCAAGIFGVISAGFCFYRLQKNRKAAIDVDYPAYGVTGPCKDVSSPNGDRKLAQSAQMYHYQHQKQQIIAVEKAGSTKNASASDVDSEEENEEGDYTVYECPGLAPTGEMEVKNPLFHEDSTPVSPPVLSAKSDKNTNN